MPTVGYEDSVDEAAIRKESKAPNRSQLEYSKSKEQGTRKDQLEFNIKLLWTRSDFVLIVNQIN